MRSRRRAAGLFLCIILTLITGNLTLAQPLTTEEPAAPAVAAFIPVTATANIAVQPVVTATAVVAVQPATTGETTYVVKPGENLFRIALRFGLSTRQLAEYNGIVNPRVIYAGQELRIPGGAAPAPTSVAPTAVPPPTTTHTVVAGDTLLRLAVRYKTTITELVRLNSLSNANVIYIGQVLNVPSDGTLVAVVPTATVSSLVGSVPTSTVEAGTLPGVVPTADQGGGLIPAPAPTGFGFGYGIEAFLVDQDVPALTDEISSLGVTWVKQHILWRDFEPVKGTIDFNTLDNIVNSLNGKGLNILLTISAAPSWARSFTFENGPPDNFGDYATFVSAVAARYVGKVQAYEVWNEPNIRREWNCSPNSDEARMCPNNYIELLRTSYGAIKAADPAAVVVSAGLAPTGFNDGVNGMTDRLFLQSLYASGLSDVTDAIGAHPLGWANPPDAVCCDAPVGVETHFQDSSFYFLETLNAYREIMVQSGDGSTAIWVTKFGWGTSEDTDPPSPNSIFISYTSLGEQAIYDPRGFDLGSQLGFVGPMFLDNLNGCQIASGAIETCYYALIGPDGAPRPAFAAVQTSITSPTIEEPLVPTLEAQPTSEAIPTLEPPTPETLGLVEPTAEIIAPLPTDSLPLDPAATPEVVGG